MDKICNSDLCTACGACMNICSKDAISMVEKGALGYVYPLIDQEKCIDCGLCQKVCPVNNPLQTKEPILAMAAVCKCDEDTKASASGGAAYSLARYIIEDEGGVVYGCELIDYKNIRHCRYTTVEDMSRMRGSKYVHSDIGLVFRDIKKDLMLGIKVLFTGTPCQVAGLKGFLRKEYDNLYCLDLVCHGVPSQKLLRDDVEYMYSRQRLDVPEGLKTQFRSIISDKKSPMEILYGNFVWNPEVDKERIPIPLKEQTYPQNDYITAFMYELILRENCYSCPYAQSSRVSDITVADYWGLGSDSVIPNGLGVSLLLSSTDKGVWLVEQSKRYINWELRPVEEAVRGNGRLKYPSSRPRERESFILRYESQGAGAYKDCLKVYRRKVLFYIHQRRTFKRYANSKVKLLIANAYYTLLSKAFRYYKLLRKAFQ